MRAISVLLVSAVTLSSVPFPQATALPVLTQEDTHEDRNQLSDNYIDLDVPRRDIYRSLNDHESQSETFQSDQGSAGNLPSETLSSSEQTIPLDYIALMENGHGQETSPEYPEADYQLLSRQHTSESTGERLTDLVSESLEDHNNQEFAGQKPLLETTTTTATAEPIPGQVAVEVDEDIQESTYNTSVSQPSQQKTITTTTKAEGETIDDKTNGDDKHETSTSSNSEDEQLSDEQISETDGESIPTTVHDGESQDATTEPVLDADPMANGIDSEAQATNSGNISNQEEYLSPTGEVPVADDLTDIDPDSDKDTVPVSPTTKKDDDADETISFQAEDHGIPTLDDDVGSLTTLQSNNSTDPSTSTVDPPSIETPEILSNSTCTEESESGVDGNEVMMDVLDANPQESIVTLETDDATQSDRRAESLQGSVSVLEENVSTTTDSNANASEEKVVPASEDSLASFFEKVKNKNQGETSKNQKNSRQSSTSFETLALQHEQINTIMEAKDATKSKTSQSLKEMSTSAGYSGLPWGVVHGMSRRLPDLELLYLLFEHHINADGKLDPNRPMARFPLSMGQEQEFDGHEMLSDHELEFLLSSQQEEIDAAMMEAEKLRKKSATKVEESSDQDDDVPSGNTNGKPVGPHVEYAFDDLVEGLDDIDKFFLSVDPPDELDVGAASGSSMQELIMGKGKEILVKKVLLAFRFLRDVVATTTKKLGAKSMWYKDRASDIQLLESIRNFDWNETSNAIRTTTSKLFDVVMEFVDDMMGRDEDRTSLQDGSIHDTLDLEAIRKLGGLQV